MVVVSVDLGDSLEVIRLGLEAPRNFGRGSSSTEIVRKKITQGIGIRGEGEYGFSSLRAM